MSKDASLAVSPSWNTVVLVCKACRKRSKGPDLKPKVIAAMVRQRAREVGRRPRVVLTDCLGLCPKAATAVATVGQDVRAQLVAVRSRADLVAVLPTPDGAAVAGPGATPVAPPGASPPGRDER